MIQPAIPAAAVNRRLQNTLLFCIFFTLVAVLEWRGNAFGSEFGGDPDEPAHYVTGLLVRDYVKAGFPAEPLSYARDYYLHYPKVALGHWPPVFYIVQAVWTLVLTPSRTSMILLMAAITALTATLLFDAIRREWSTLAAFTVSLVFLSLPTVLQFSGMVMTEMLLTLLVTLAVLEYGRYLDKPRWQSAVWFSVWATLAVLTKGTGIALAFVPPLSVLMQRRVNLLRRFSFWLPAAVVILIAAPWYLMIPGAQHESVARFGGVSTVLESRLSGTPRVWRDMIGSVPFVLAVVGLFVSALRIRRSEVSGLWVAAISSLIGSFVLRIWVGAWEDRQLIMCIPILMMLAAAGAAWILRQRWWSRWPEKLGPILAVAGAGALVILNLQHLPIKRHYGYSETAQDLLRDPQLRNSVFLVCSSASGEGMLISEVAMRENRPGHIVLRGSKMLAVIDWMGYSYRLLFKTPEEVIGYLEGIPTGIVVIDGEGRRTPHGTLLMKALQERSHRWTMTARYRAEIEEDDILVYRLQGHEGRPVGRIRIPTESGLFRNPR